MTTEQRNQRLAKFEKQIELLTVIRKQLRLLDLELMDASASRDINDAILNLQRAGKKLLMAS